MIFFYQNDRLLNRLVRIIVTKNNVYIFISLQILTNVLFFMAFVEMETAGTYPEILIVIVNLDTELQI